MSELYISSYEFGHAVYLKQDPQKSVQDDWRYVDTDEPTDTAAPRKCPKCDKFPTKDGHDPCIANLPGVAYACCGHGVEDGYVKFYNGVVVKGVVKQSKPCN